MDLRKCILTKNRCYIEGYDINVKGIMWHSTGANNPNIWRYVQPDDGKIGNNPYGTDWNQYKPGGISVCVHAFIGKDKYGNVCTYQTLPWNMRGWHGGGSCNESYIGFEICEDGLNDQDYFNKAYKEACELTAYLCQQFGLNPNGQNVIICHQDGYRLGIATNHGDVYHWFNKFGKTMDDVRCDVTALINGDTKPADPDTNDETYELVTNCPVYMNASNAKNHKDSVGTYTAGSYFVFNKSDGMINITKKSGAPGGWVNPSDNQDSSSFKPYMVKVNVGSLNIRTGPGTNYAVASGSPIPKGVYTIVAEADGPGASKWGKLKSGAGYISLDYAKKM